MISYFLYISVFIVILDFRKRNRQQYLPSNCKVLTYSLFLSKCFLIRGFWLPRTYFFFSGASWFSTSKFMLQPLQPVNVVYELPLLKTFPTTNTRQRLHLKSFCKTYKLQSWIWIFLKLFFMAVITQVFWKFRGTLGSIKSIHVELFEFLFY